MMQRRGNRRRNIIARIFSVLSAVILILVILVCIPLTVPQFFGFKVYHVITGSMEPSIPVGSLIYVDEIEPSKVVEEDVIAFYSSTDNGAIITHRVVSNRIVSGEFITKGDANDKEDMNPVPYESLIGKVKLSIPILGHILAVVTQPSGKIAVGCMIGVALVFYVIGDILSRKK